MPFEAIRSQALCLRTMPVQQLITAVLLLLSSSFILIVEASPSKLAHYDSVGHVALTAFLSAMVQSMVSRDWWLARIRRTRSPKKPLSTTACREYRSSVG